MDIENFKYNLLSNMLQLLIDQDASALNLVEQTKSTWVGVIRWDSLGCIIRMTVSPVNSMDDLVNIARAVLARLATRGVYYTDGTWGVIPLESLWDITPLVLQEILTILGENCDFLKSKPSAFDSLPLSIVRQKERPVVQECHQSTCLYVPSQRGGQRESLTHDRPG